ncbi:MAG: carbohydrate binding family 9 domain-containing protein, partial [Bacteroidota bacterium]|nr:carbohydrate binding family 9 domain-containing protein [Bacteroidota bacterium]
MLRGLVFAVVFLSAHVALSQSKTLTAVKTQHSPVIDGKLDDAVWQSAATATDFVQNYPSFGKTASVKTEVRFLYDNDAIYIHAYLHDNPSLIRKQITARDGELRQDVDYFCVAFDTYNDHQNGFLFLVTPANVQTDAKINASAQLNYGYLSADRSWDAVWQSSTHQTTDGWEAEIRIPYISLRFAKKDKQTWGLQFVRFTRRNNEAS